MSVLLTLNTAIAFDAVTPTENFQVTDFKSMEQLTSYWNTMKGKRWLKESTTNCYDRAHVWSYELYKNFKIHSKKIIIHYSDKYMNELDDGWSWHVAPLVTLNGVEMVLDRQFMDKPITKKEWLAHFTKYAIDKLERKRKDLVIEINNAQWKIDKIRRDEGKFWWGSISSYKEDIREKMAELASWGLSYDKPATFSCKPIRNIEEMDYPTLTYKKDKEKNKNQIEWCYVQEMSMYYHGLPELRLLNYGNSNMSQIPFRANLDNARRKGANYEKHEFDMIQVWKSIDRAFEKADMRFRTEYYIYKRLTDKD